MKVSLHENFQIYGVAKSGNLGACRSCNYIESVEFAKKLASLCL